MKRSWICSVATLVAVTSFAWTGEDAQAIINKAIKARGKDGGLSGSKGMTWKAKGVMHLFGMKNEYQAQYWYAAPDRFRFVMKAEFGGMKLEITAATDGKIAWESAMDMTREMDKQKTEEFQSTTYGMYVSSLTPLKNKEFTLTKLDEVKVEGKPAVGVKVEKKGNRDISLYFDKTTGLLVKMQTRVFDEFVKKEVTQQVLFTDYREVEGAKVFGRMVIQRDGMTFIEETMSDMQTLDTVDPKLFRMPSK